MEDENSKRRSGPGVAVLVVIGVLILMYVSRLVYKFKTISEGDVMALQILLSLDVFVYVVYGILRVFAMFFVVILGGSS